MLAEQFYTSTNQHAIELVLISQAHLEKQQDGLPEYIANRLASQHFQAKAGQLVIMSNEKGRIDKVYLGTGKEQTLLALAKAACQLPPGSYCSDSSLSNNELVVWSLAQYRFDKYKPCEEQPRILSVSPDALNEVLIEAQAVFYVRDLINTPANDMAPEDIGRHLSDLAEKHGAQFQQWVGEELIKHRFNAIYTVGQAASSEPRLLSLTWGEEHHPLISLVGKGVCFDSGGLDIKPSGAMRLMKKDMGGAAQVFGLAEMIMSMKLPVRLHVLIPAVENAIASNAFRPGDIITMYNGLTVEVDNTDAEGRLILADALVKACEEQPELLLDFATLTGAARVAVGTEISAMFTDDDKLAEEISESAQEAVDPVWRLPMYSGYESMLDSSIADMVNSSATPYAGATTAALFLKRFVQSDVPWIHFDIMAWNVGNKPGKPEGGEAMGIRAIAHYLNKRFS
jgi:leucyl aminopeptidase